MRWCWPGVDQYRPIMAGQHDVLSSRASTSQGPALGVFCGSRAGHDGSALTLARELGGALAEGPGVDLVYGGAGIGVMGTLADAGFWMPAAVWSVSSQRDCSATRYPTAS
ncbi:MAG: hypothetical protein CM1200mP26_02490 [Acidimicrobiales bacterium]|nr:MAG: hypothetical protein CM1200mP26_02490 [Acidimicrobiales bacterium]